jgi:hypothetical protein
MKTSILILVGVFFSVMVQAANQIELPKFRVTAQVLDEQGKPISAAEIELIFGEPFDANAIVKIEGLTDSEGKFTGEGHSGGSYGARIRKKGFYLSGLGAPSLVDPESGRWKPWDPLVVTVLRRIGNPTALYAKRVQAEIPELNKPCGYDLEKGDWVTPHGKGVTSDFIFTAVRETKSADEFDVQVQMTFANPRDGVLKTEIPAVGKNSVFKWEREAPETGFDNQILLRMQSSKTSITQTSGNADRFFFRVRTHEENGRIMTANYGKIAGGLRLDGINTRKTCLILFTYYLNPTSLDRNLEWDPKRDLLIGLTHDQTPREP